MTGTNIWEAVLARIETKVNRHSFYTWFKPTAFVADREGRLVVRVPNTLFRDWLTKHYSAVLEEALREVERPGSSVEFVTDDAPSAPEPVVVVPAVEPALRFKSSNFYHQSLGLTTISTMEMRGKSVATPPATYQECRT